MVVLCFIITNSNWEISTRDKTLSSLKNPAGGGGGGGGITTMEKHNKGFLGTKDTNVINGLISEARAGGGGGESEEQYSIKGKYTSKIPTKMFFILVNEYLFFEHISS